MSWRDWPRVTGEDAGQQRYDEGPTTERGQESTDAGLARRARHTLPLWNTKRRDSRRGHAPPLYIRNGGTAARALLPRSIRNRVTRVGAHSPSGIRNRVTVVARGGGEDRPAAAVGRAYFAENGSTTGTPAGRKCATFRVTTVSPWSSAVAAISMSVGCWGCASHRRPQRVAIATSTGRMRCE